MAQYFRSLVKKFLPEFLKRRIYLYRFGENKRKRNAQLERLKTSSRPVRVLFIASSLPMWKGQGIYELLAKDNRFDPQIIIAPFFRFNKEEARRYSDDITEYLNQKGINAKRTIDRNFDLEHYLATFDPDIVFPCQHYEGIYRNRLDVQCNKQRIYCYIPYGLIIDDNEEFFNTDFLNLCWKFYLPTKMLKEIAIKKMVNKGKNVKIVGDPDFDKFYGKSNNPWKEISDGKIRKKIIWAPHFSINPTEILHRASFLWLFDVMLKIANEYKDSIQFAFKPHPNLHSVLCILEGWGKEKTDEYYNKWSSMYNSQLEEGNFIDLFSHSDAMIHDCSSFTGEYLYVNKPVLFTSQNLETIRKESNEFGIKCLDMHYIGKSVKDIRWFIDEVVLKDNDRMKSEREDFYNNYLVPPNGQSVAENIYYDMLKSLGLSPNK